MIDLTLRPTPGAVPDARRALESLDDAVSSQTLEDLERFARRHRADLLAALFPGLRADDDTVTIPLRPQA